MFSIALNLQGYLSNISVLFQGSYSTKITAVVGTLKMIKSRDPGAKALVFSSVSI